MVVGGSLVCLACKATEGDSVLPSAGAFREFAPALVLSLLSPKLTWSEAETQVRSEMLLRH
jgi:hypothetical protein